MPALMSGLITSRQPPVSVTPQVTEQSVTVPRVDGEARRLNDSCAIRVSRRARAKSRILRERVPCVECERRADNYAELGGGQRSSRWASSCSVSHGGRMSKLRLRERAREALPVARRSRDYGTARAAVEEARR